uniref:C2H2-type domain-containing protein n=1 Tax=Macrostomum lignano TaxID=282301 RepID=A0A1I8ILK6_9PLAT
MEVTVPSSAYCGFYNKPSGPGTNQQSVSDLMLQQQGQQISAKRQYRGGPPPPHMLQPYRQQQPQFKRKFNNGLGRNNSSVVVAPQRPPVQQFHCELCDAKCTGEAMFKLHREGSKHLKKEKEKKFRELSEAKDPEVYCDICNLTLHPELMKSHRAGVKHRKAAAGALNRGGSGAKKSPTGKSALPPGIYRLDPAKSAADKDKPPGGATEASSSSAANETAATADAQNGTQQQAVTVQSIEQYLSSLTKEQLIKKLLKQYQCVAQFAMQISTRSKRPSCISILKLTGWPFKSFNATRFAAKASCCEVCDIAVTSRRPDGGAPERLQARSAPARWLHTRRSRVLC